MSGVEGLDNENEIFAYLEENGAIHLEGMDEGGEAVFSFDMEKLEEIMPELYQQVIDEIDKDLMVLYEKGMVSLEYDEELNAQFKLTEKGINLFENPPFL